MKKRKIKDLIAQILTYLFSSFGLVTFIAILVFVFSNGLSTLSFEMLTSDYHQEVVNVNYEQENYMQFEEKEIEDSYFSIRWGIALKDATDNVGESIVIVSYVDEKSPLRGTMNQTTKESYALKENQSITKVVLKDQEGNLILALSRYKAKTMVELMDQGVAITDLQITTPGGGIRGSLITTLLLILLTLIIALPLGIGGAIYLSEYAKKNKFTKVLRSLIEMTSGIPSIIFGLVGATIFIPFLNVTIQSDGPSILAGAMTLAIMLLPIVIRTTEESLKVIPQSFRHASLALGASKTQTIFKVVLPNSISGILTATLLSIGRIIGESAALIYTIGTAIKDQVAASQNSTSLAVHIWSIMAGENPNYDGACAIAIIILLVVLVLNLLVKLISKRTNRMEVKS